ncbi:MAG: hypothetical protein KatS3mg100_288 [Candidatus Parcubacteria bacterium]|nr:MAG: hypothetical protein KatS3mg100_288 [Candidatus Parcubacteria bacterium]
MSYSYLTLAQRSRTHLLGFAGFAAAVCIASLTVFAQSAYAQETSARGSARGEAVVSEKAQDDPVSVKAEVEGEVKPSREKPHLPVPLPPSRDGKPVGKPGDGEARPASAGDHSPTLPPSYPPRGRDNVVPLAEKQEMENPKDKAHERFEERREKAKERFEERKEKAQERLEARKEQILERARNNLADMFRRVKERLEAAVVRLEKLADKLERRIAELEEGFRERGFDGTAARAKLQEARNAIAQAKAVVTALNVEVEADVNVSADDQTTNTAETMNNLAAQLREQAQARREQAREPIEAIKRAHAALVAATREVHAALGSVRTQAQSSASGKTSTTAGETEAKVSTEDHPSISN